MNSQFGIQLIKRLSSDLSDVKFGNFDGMRYPNSKRRQFLEFLDRLLKLVGLRRDTGLHPNTLSQLEEIGPLWEGLDWLYNRLADEKSKSTLIEVLAYRILGYRYTRLSTNDLQHAQHLSDVSGALISKSKVHQCDLLDGWIDEFAIPGAKESIRLKAHKLHVVHTYLAEQYRYKSELTEVGVKPGDIVVDGGGCWGDTALYFANACGPDGQVHVFEFSRDNIKLLMENVSNNPHLQSQIHLQANAMWDKSDLQITFSENGPSTRPIVDSSEGGGGGVTLSIDDWFQRSSMDKVDFIKLDVEGSEERCLIGAKNSISKFKPRLAVAVYHSLNDFVVLPKLIDQMNPDYKLYLGHYTIQLEETILFAE